MSFSVSSLPYLNNIEAIANHFESQHLTLLDSPVSDHADACWSILTAQPIEEFAIHDNQPASIQALKENTQRLSNLLNKVETSYDHLPFTGGVIGICAYDLGITEKDIPAPAHTAKLTPLAAVRLFNWAYLWNHESKQSFLVYHSATTGPTQQNLIALYNSARSSSERKATLHTSRFSPSWNKNDYALAFNKAKQLILEGDVYQINLAQHYEATFSGTPLSGFFNLKNRANAPFSCYWHDESWQLVSASPERFISIEKGFASTKPIKGTRPNLGIKGEQSILANSTKDRAENLMIVDLLRNDLSKHCSNVKVPTLFAIESFPTVHHMVSTITGKVKPNSTSLDVFWDAFPGGSITGAPKKRAMEIIHELEKHERSFYCGSLFYQSTNGHFDSNILIRSFVFENQKVHSWAGGGIVADSSCEAEYQECSDKISKLMLWLSENQPTNTK